MAAADLQVEQQRRHDPRDDLHALPGEGPACVQFAGDPTPQRRSKIRTNASGGFRGSAAADGCTRVLQTRKIILNRT
jgi:hypothetical protein